MENGCRVEVLRHLYNRALIGTSGEVIGRISSTTVIVRCDDGRERPMRDYNLEETSHVQKT